MSKFEIPKDKDEIKRQIKALQSLLPIDDKKVIGKVSKYTKMRLNHLKKL